MKEAALVIMAAGLGSRFGEGIKQLQKVGPNGEIIIDYSIHDALEAGFTKVVFIIRQDIEDEFKQVIGSRIEKICPVTYVFQDKNDLPQGFRCPEGRVKPWGTGQAVLTCKAVLDVPFAVINADDYYGKNAFRRVYRFLSEHEGAKYEYCMAGFFVRNTLSDNGPVSRGICAMDEAHYLKKVTETHGISSVGNGQVEDENGNRFLDDSLVSMNMWGLTPEFLGVLEEKFADFLQEKGMSDLKSEYLLPEVIDQMLQNGQASVKVLETPDQWFGVTYAQDKEGVAQAFAKLVADGVYPAKLWS